MDNSGKKVKAVIFDLDDTLYDCTNTLSKKRRKELACVLTKYKHFTVEKAEEILQKDEGVRRYGSYEQIARNLNLPATFLDEVDAILKRPPTGLEEIKPFPDVIPTLETLKRQGLKVFLVSSGNLQEQEAKLNQLGLRPLFNEVMIVQRDGEGKVKGKCFHQLLEKYHLTPKEVLCVGDRVEDELKAASSLGIRTALLEHGQHYERFTNSQQKEFTPEHCLKGVGELVALLL